MMNFHFEDLEKRLKSTRLAIDKIRTSVDLSQGSDSRVTEPDASPFSYADDFHKPHDELINMHGNVLFGCNVSRHTLRKRRSKTPLSVKHDEMKRKETLKEVDDGDSMNVLKSTKKETKQTFDVVDDFEEESLNINGCSIRVVNKSWFRKQNVARGWSESLREIFLTSPEKSSNDSTAAPLVPLSDIETSLEIHSSDADSSWTEYSDKCGNDTSWSVNVDTQADSDSVISDFSSSDAAMMPVLRLSRNECASESLDSSIHLNDNDSWSIYSTSGCASNTSGVSADVDSDGTSGEAACDESGSQPDSSLINVETEIINTEFGSKGISSDSIILKAYSESIELNSQDTGNCLEKQSETTAALNEFQHDFDFLAKCTNKMSTPEKNSPVQSKEESQYLEEPYVDETPDTSSSIDSTDSESDSSHTNETCSYVSTTDTNGSTMESSYLRRCQSSQLQTPPSASSNFVHGISPLCKTKEIKSASSSHSTKFVRRRIIVLNKSLQDASTKLAYPNSKDKHPTRNAALCRRSSPNVRRRIVFTNSKLQHDNGNSLHVDRASFSESIRDMITRESKDEANSVFTEANDMKRTDNTHSSQHLLPKCAFNDETEEAVYYLITKYLDNKECPW